MEYLIQIFKVFINNIILNDYILTKNEKNKRKYSIKEIFNLFITPYILYYLQNLAKFI